MLLTLKTQIKIFFKATLLQHNCNHYSLYEGERQQQKSVYIKVICSIPLTVEKMSFNFVHFGLNFNFIQVCRISFNFAHSQSTK